MVLADASVPDLPVDEEEPSPRLPDLSVDEEGMYFLYFMIGICVDCLILGR